MPDLPAQAIAQRKLLSPQKGSTEFVDRAFSDAHRRQSFRLALRINYTGSKSWCIRYRSGGRGSAWSRQTLGPLETMDNAAARVKSAEIYKGLLEGGDPAREAKRETEKRITGGKDVAWLLGEFIERHCAENVKPKTAQDYQELLSNHLLPQCGSLPIGSMVKRDMIEALDQIQKLSGAQMAERVRVYAGVMFNWATSRDLIDIPPTYKLKSWAVNKSRERVLIDDEVRAIWKACGEYRRGESTYGPFIRMLIVTGQRRSEIASMRREEIDLEKLRYTIPVERNKSGRTHDVPLSPQAIRIIKPRLNEEYDHIFPASRARYAGIDTPDMIAIDKPMAGWSKMKKGLDELSGVTDWRLHDIRRTVGTGMAELEVPRITISRILNHKEGGVTSIYDRHSYYKEKLAALELWGRRLDQILTPDGGENVVPLPTRAG
jgi:integrase